MNCLSISTLLSGKKTRIQSDEISYCSKIGVNLKLSEVISSSTLVAKDRVLNSLFLSTLSVLLLISPRVHRCFY